MATAASGVSMSGLSVRILRATQRYVPSVRVPDGIRHENHLKELRNDNRRRRRRITDMIFLDKIPKEVERTQMIHAKDIVTGEVSIEPDAWLPEPYLFVYDTSAQKIAGAGSAEAHNLARAVNLLATNRGYRVVTHTMDMEGRAPHYVCMVKEGYFKQ